MGKSMSEKSNLESCEEKFLEMKADNRIWFGEDGNNVPRINPNKIAT